MAEPIYLYAMSSARVLSLLLGLALVPKGPRRHRRGCTATQTHLPTLDVRMLETLGLSALIK